MSDKKEMSVTTRSGATNAALTIDEAQDLAARIRAFPVTHARTAAAYDPNWDSPEERFNGPDPSTLLMAAKCLEAGETPSKAWSDWSSGCYAPYGDKAARELHDGLVREIGLAHGLGVDASPQPAPGV